MSEDHLESGEAERRILGSFVAGVAECLNSSRAEELQVELETSEPPEVGEREMALRCLNAAVEAWRSEIGGKARRQPIKNAEDAFDEWEFIDPIVVDTPREQVKAAIREALLVAAEALGPFPGGEPAAFRDPAEPPRMLERAEPRPVDLRLIAARSGRTIGLLTEEGSADPSAVLQKIAAVDG